MALAARAAALAVAALAAAGPAAAIEPGGPFEGAWRAHIGARAGAYAIARAPAPDGSPAIRFELRPGDCMENRVDDCATHRERAELRSTEQPPLGSERWYRYRVFLPREHPEIGVEEIIGQFHDDEAPVLSTRYRGGRAVLVVQTRRGGKAAQAVAPFPKGRWIEVRTHCRWSKAEDGFCRVTIDGVPRLDYRGPTLTARAVRGPYLKIGLYRSHLDRFGRRQTPTGVVYFADVASGVP